MPDHVVLAGAGPMATAYAKVLSAMGKKFRVIGRGEASAAAFAEKTGIVPTTGGLETYLKNNPPPVHAIVAVGVEALAATAEALLDAGCKHILVEKPGGLNSRQITGLARKAAASEADVVLGYNRRFHAATIAAERIIAEDGGVQSFNFEFTEWSHKITPISKGPGVKEHWFLANSSHVVDLAYFLGGKPGKISCYTKVGSIPWHPAAAVYAGAGVSENDALFSYRANWQSAGRWQLEVLTAKRRLLFCPLETLQEQLTGSIEVKNVEGIDYSADENFKPGLYLQTEAFLNGDLKRFCSIHEQSSLMKILTEMANYGND